MKRRKDLPGQAFMDGCGPDDIRDSTIPRTASLALTPRQGKALEFVRGFGGVGVTAKQLKAKGFGRGIMSKLWDIGAVDRRISRAGTIAWAARR